jgi:hypothetical protein
MTEQFLRTLTFLLQFTPNLSEHIHGHVLNLLSCMFFITQHDQSLAIQIIQRLLSTFQLYQQQSISKKKFFYFSSNSFSFSHQPEQISMNVKQCKLNHQMHFFIYVKISLLK